MEQAAVCAVREAAATGDLQTPTLKHTYFPAYDLLVGMYFLLSFLLNSVVDCEGAMFFVERYINAQRLLGDK